MNAQKWSAMLDDLLEGQLSEAEFLELEAQLTVDDALRKEYLRRVTLSVLLQQEADNRAEDIVLPSSGSLTNRWGWLWTCAVAASLLLAVAFWPRSPSQSSGNARAHLPETEAAGYGVITGQDGVVWQSTVGGAEGTLIPTGDLHLKSGVLQLELFSGVSVVVEGPANFAVESPMHMHVASGKVRAHVPEPAHGFRLTTQDGEVVDLGTDFAVDVNSAGSELHVLEGEVSLRGARADGDGRRLATGQAVRITNGVLSELPADPQRFVGQQEAVGRLQSARKTRRERWLRWSESLAADQRLVVLYQLGRRDAEEPWRADRRVANRATARSSEGAVVAASRTVDRWQQRGGALDFSPMGSRVRLAIPGEFGSLTLLCWVKIHSLDRWYNSLFLTDGHDQHEPHWQIMDDGRLFFSVKKRDQWDASKGEKDKHVYFSPSFWDPSLSGQWLMIATTYDIERRQVTHFVNGKPISREAIPEEYLVTRVRIGNASLCNWSQPERDEPRFAVRNLNGSLDEFAMFRVALSPAEIEEIYEHGQP